jgi:hypothetical protein
MFAKTITGSDAFLEMPQSSQCLYFQLGMRADDDGFVNSPKAIMREVGGKDDDMKLLFAKKFIIPFESGVIVIKHWRINNYLRSDRYTPTKYKEELALLHLDENNAYSLSVNSKTGIPLVYQPDTVYGETQVRLGKDSLDQDSIDNRAKKFVPPTLQEVMDYCNERKNNIDPQRFIDFYISKGWMVGKNKMKDWQAAIRTWEQKSNEPKKPTPTKQNAFTRLQQLREEADARERDN